MTTPGRGGDNLVKQLTAAWEQAQSQLRELRQQVEAATRLARAQLDTQTFTKERDRALRDLGEAFWKAHQSGQAKVSTALQAALAQVAKAEQKVASSKANITSLLRETEAPPAKPAAKPPPKRR